MLLRVVRTRVELGLYVPADSDCEAPEKQYTGLTRDHGVFHLKV